MYKTILVPVDLTTPDDTQRLLGMASELAAQWGSDLHVANIVPDMGMAMVGAAFKNSHEQETIEAATSELAASVQTAGVEAEMHVGMGTIYDQVITLAEKVDADLILIGAHRPELRDYLLGSNAARLVRHSNRSVLVVRD
ncbi:MAG: universal stress protein [Sedimentitalea sp.]